MGLTQNIYRRGGVYWWKSRIKSNCDKRPSRTFAISLGIHEPSLAKILGAELTAFACRAFYTGDGAMLDDNKRQFLLKTFLSEQRIRYDRVRTCDRHRKGNMAEEIRQDIINAEAYRIVGQQGVLHACVTEEDRKRMHKLKLSDTDIKSVDRLVQQITGKPVPGYPIVKMLGASRPHAQARQIYTDLLKSIDIEVAPIDVMEAERLDYVARSTALAESAALRQKDWSVKDFQTADTLLEALQAADAISPRVEKRVERTALDIGQPTKIVETDISTAPSMNGHIVDIGESLKSNKIDDKHWDVKTAKQATMIFKLFAKFLFETGSIQQITDVKPSHLETFDRFLRHLRRNFGKSPADSACTIAALTPSKTELDADHKLSEKQRKFGLSLGTRKRHWGFIAQLFEKAETDGFAIDPKLKPAKYARGKNTTRARNQRPTPETSSIEAFFQSAPFTGYLDWQKMFGDKGNDIFHRAAYYVPILLIYHGMRREEACGLMVSEIITIEGELTYIDLKVNQFRRLKNNSSIRKVPLHPELIRLGFLDYCKAVAGLGYDLLFPDLHSPTTQSPLGDRLYDELKPALVANNLDLHKMRHYFNSALEEEGASVKMRADIIGHAGESQTDERYAKSATLKRMLAAIEKAPIVTRHLEPMPIKLLPWITERTSAPWARKKIKRI